jgi:ElaB/YqjD/DUF883 family membrane-anchored ribosome-binding protein
MKQEQTGAQALIDSGNKLSQDLRDTAGEAGDLLKGYGKDKLQEAREALTEAHAAATDGAKQLQGVADEFVHAHPWKAVGAAAAAGLIVGLLVARR